MHQQNKMEWRGQLVDDINKLSKALILKSSNESMGVHLNSFSASQYV